MKGWQCLLFATVVAAVGCSREATPRELLADVMRTQIDSFGRPWWRDSLDARLAVRAETSRAVPGLVYHIAEFSPPLTADITFTAVAGSTSGQTHALTSIEAWERLAAEADWHLNRPGFAGDSVT